MPRLRRFYRRGVIEAGCDEAGRGCLAGPVYAAAVILDPNKRIRGLNDSKQLKPAVRETLRKRIEKSALAWAVASVTPEEIDKINILNASFRAMHMAVAQLTTRPECLLIDGNRFYSSVDIPHICIIKGDAKFASIAAASILAKTYRDAYMKSLHEQFPVYDWNQNVGYPTRAHRRALIVAGPTLHHRHSFRLLPDTQMSLFDE